MAEINAFSKIQDVTPMFEYQPQNLNTYLKLGQLKNEHAQGLIDSASKSLSQFDSIKALDIIQDPVNGVQRQVSDLQDVNALKKAYATKLTDLTTSFRTGAISPYEYSSSINSINSEINGIKSSPLIQRMEQAYNDYNASTEDWFKNHAGKNTGTDPIGYQWTNSVLNYTGAKNGSVFSKPTFFTEVDRQAEIDSIFKGMNEQLTTQVEKALNISRQRYGEKDWLLMTEKYMHGIGADRVGLTFESAFENSKLATTARRVATNNVNRALALGEVIRDRTGKPITLSDQNSVQFAINEQFQLQKEAMRNEVLNKYPSSKLNFNASITAFPKEGDGSEDELGLREQGLTGIPNPNAPVAQGLDFHNGKIQSSEKASNWTRQFNEIFNAHQKAAIVPNAYTSAVLGPSVGKINEGLSWLGSLVQATGRATLASLQGIGSEERAPLTQEQKQLVAQVRKRVELENPELFTQSKSTSGRIEGNDPAKLARQQLETLTFDKIKDIQNQVSLVGVLPTSKEETFYGTTNKEAILNNNVIFDPVKGLSSARVGSQFLKDELEIAPGSEEYNKFIKEVKFDIILNPKNPYSPKGLVYSWRGKSFVVDAPRLATQQDQSNWVLGQAEFGTNPVIRQVNTDGSFTSTVMGMVNGKLDVLEMYRTMPDGSTVKINVPKVPKAK